MELYVHLPFCARKCRYCDFASYAGHEGDIPGYVDDLITEMRRASQRLARPEMDTAFLGGGTPSLLPAPQLDRILRSARECFSFAPDAECTSEANPGTLTEAWLDAAVSGGVNRLSMGMQALQPELLRMLGRIHDFDHVASSVRMARQAGIRRISLDLMFGLPGQTERDWCETLDAALSLSPEHLSCYGLIPEEGTPLKRDLDEGRLTLPGDDAERAMYDEAITRLAAHGFHQYEISNFALPGCECRHNLGYWRQVPYLGVGASSASMLPDPEGKSAYLRLTNPPDLPSYHAMISQDRPDLRETTPVTREEARFETMMLGLRTLRGVSEADFAAMHGVTLDTCYGPKLRELEGEGLLRHEDGRWFLTRRGMDIQNAVLVELMD